MADLGLIQYLLLPLAKEENLIHEASGQCLSVIPALTKDVSVQLHASHQERDIALANPQAMVWARCCMRAEGTSKAQFMNDHFPLTKGKARASTTFDSCLQGKVVPALTTEAGEPAGPLNIERKHFGTLKWLIHPLWSVLEDVERYSLRGLHTLMAATEEETLLIVMKPNGDRWTRRRRSLKKELDELLELGSLDALAALAYLIREAVLLGRGADIAFAEANLGAAIEQWDCLKWLDLTFRRKLIRHFQGLLVGNYGSEPIKRDDAVFDAAFEAIRAQRFSWKRAETPGAAEAVFFADPVFVLPEYRPQDP